MYKASKHFFFGTAIADIYGKTITIRQGERVIIRRASLSPEKGETPPANASKHGYLIEPYVSTRQTSEFFSHEAAKIIVQEDFLTVEELIAQLQALNAPKARVVAHVGGDREGFTGICAPEKLDLITNVSSGYYDGEHMFPPSTNTLPTETCVKIPC